jgi:segregation and condensation protein B
VQGENLKNILEAVLMASETPLGLERLQDLFEAGGRPAKTQLRQALEALSRSLADSALELAEVAGGWRLQVDSAYAPWVAKLWEERPARYSRAMLETLALVVYRQPVTRGEIEEIRGVSLSQSIVNTLLEREWVRVVGHRELPGRPALYATTNQFLDDFNLKSLDQLPPLPEIRDEAALNEAMAQLARGGAVMSETNTDG